MDWLRQNPLAQRILTYVVVVVGLALITRKVSFTLIAIIPFIIVCELTARLRRRRSVP